VTKKKMKKPWCQFKEKELNNKEKKDKKNREFWHKKTDEKKTHSALLSSSTSTSTSTLNVENLADQVDEIKLNVPSVDEESGGLQQCRPQSG